MNNNEFDRISESIIRIAISITSIYRKQSHVKTVVYDPTYMILGLLVWEDMPTSEIGRRLCRSKPNMTALLDKMIEEGLVSRSNDKDDRRIIKISITKRARNLLREKKNQMKQILKTSLKNLERKDLDRLRRALEEVSSIFSKGNNELRDRRSCNQL
jgi:DNA-binding MarR family transcriptional regulator